MRPQPEMNDSVLRLSGSRQLLQDGVDRRSAPPLDQRPSGGNHDAQDAKVEQQMNGTEMDDHLRERRRLDARAYQPVLYAVEGEPHGLERQRGPDPPTRGSYALHDVFPRSACHAQCAVYRREGAHPFRCHASVRLWAFRSVSVPFHKTQRHTPEPRVNAQKQQKFRRTCAWWPQGDLVVRLVCLRSISRVWRVPPNPVNRRLEDWSAKDSKPVSPARHSLFATNQGMESFGDHRNLSRLDFQRRLRLFQPERHVHLAVQRSSGHEMLLGFSRSTCLSVELAEATMAVGGERAHPKFFGKRLRLRVGSEGDFQVRGSPGRSDRPEHASRPGFKPPFSVGLSHFQSPSGNTLRSLGVAANEECFGQEHMRPGAVHPKFKVLDERYAPFQVDEAFDQSPRPS